MREKSTENTKRPKRFNAILKGEKEYGKQEDKGSEYGRIQTDYQHNKVGVCNGRRKASAS